MKEKKNRNSRRVVGISKTSKKGSTTRKAMQSAVNFTKVDIDVDTENLKKFDHIVVLMMENRSFDHMLGYLSFEENRLDVDGLKSGMVNLDENGKTYPIHHLTETAFSNGQDPCHEGACVAEQLSGNNGGFVKSFQGKYRHDPDPGIVMGYYNKSDLPVYDQLTREYAICNRWFCSVDGATWPNRLYSLTGRADGVKDNKKVPIYDIPSFVRHLDSSDVSWRWYSHILMPTLRLVDSEYYFGHFDNFAFFDRKPFGKRCFLDDVSNGDLPSVSWIDPKFISDPLVGVGNSNDDHPPSDVLHGQELVLKLYNAIANGPKWNKTLLVVTYDEHGGFFDHVPVEMAEDDNAAFRNYGPRVPAFIISPYVARASVSNTTFDHTSIIKTILLRFCASDDGAIPDMGTRVNNAKHLGCLLTLDKAREPVMLTQPIKHIADWQTNLFKKNLMTLTAGELPAGAPMNEFQEGLLAAKEEMEVKRQQLKTHFPIGQP